MNYSLTRNEDHTYILDGQMLPGITTVLKAKDNPAISAWLIADLCERLGVKKSADAKKGWKEPRYVKGLWEPGKAYTAQEIALTVNEARKGSTKKSDKAKDTGTDAHAWIEACITCDTMGTEYPPVPADPEAACAAMSWLTWRQAHEIEWLSAETITGSKQYRYGGTFDARAVVDGVRCLIDWKTSGGLYPEVWLQLTALTYAYAEQSGDDTPYVRVGARIPKDGKPLEWEPAPWWATEDFCMEVFLGLLATHRFELAVKAAKDAGR